MEPSIRKADCPYCKGVGSFITEGIDIPVISSSEMLVLFNSGWRRFGTYFWRQLEGSCCEQRPIRTNTMKFINSDGHKKVWKRIEKYVRMGKGRGDGTRCPKQKQLQVTKGMRKGVLMKGKSHHDNLHRCPAGHQMRFMKGKRPGKKEYAVRVACDVCLKEGLDDLPEGYYHCSTCVVDSHTSCLLPKTPSCHSCNKSMIYLVHTLPSGYKFATCDVCQKTDLNHIDKGYYHCQRCLLDRHIDECCSFRPFPDHIMKTVKGQKNWEYRGVKEIEVKVMTPSFTQEKYDMFLQYHKVIHDEEEGNIAVLKIGDNQGDDDCKKFKEVLVKSALQSETFHVEYRLDGVLFMVTVLDILPDVINSVYCFYDPKYRWYMPGRFSILYELAWAKACGISYYSLGTYNEKMSYKADYRPFQILNQKTLLWEDDSDILLKCSEKEAKRSNGTQMMFLLIVSIPMLVAFLGIGKPAVDSVLSYVNW